MEKTNREISAFNGMAEAYLRQPGISNKVSHALKRAQKLIKKQTDDCQDDLEEVSVNLASVDEKGNLILSGTSYVYTPSNRLQLAKKQRGVLDKKVKIDQYLMDPADIPKDLLYDFRKAFTGFIIAEEPEDEEEGKKKKSDKVTTPA